MLTTHDGPAVIGAKAKYWSKIAIFSQLAGPRQNKHIFSTSPDPRHYTTLLNVDVLNFYLTLDYLTLITIRLLRFGVKVKRAYCRDNLLA